MKKRLYLGGVVVCAFFFYLILVVGIFSLTQDAKGMPTPPCKRIQIVPCNPKLYRPAHGSVGVPYPGGMSPGVPNCSQAGSNAFVCHGHVWAIY